MTYFPKIPRWADVVRSAVAVLYGAMLALVAVLSASLLTFFTYVNTYDGGFLEDVSVVVGTIPYLTITLFALPYAVFFAMALSYAKRHGRIGVTSALFAWAIFFAMSIEMQFVLVCAWYSACL